MRIEYLPDTDILYIDQASKHLDLRALAADLHEREQQHPERLVSFPPKPVQVRKTA